VIGMPVAARKPIPAMEAALARAVQRGVVIVAAAGNVGESQPAWPARYAADPRFAPTMLVAGAVDKWGWLAPWSNKSGVAAKRYISAPGVKLPVDCDATTCVLKSGTSYSVSYVAGALAMLLSRRPDLSGPDAADALLASARPMGGGEAGRGRLDIDKALTLAQRGQDGGAAGFASAN
jgi:subtilisin family serine protease